MAAYWAAKLFSTSAMILCLQTHGHSFSIHESSIEWPLLGGVIQQAQMHSKGRMAAPFLVIIAHIIITTQHWVCCQVRCCFGLQIWSCCLGRTAAVCYSTEHRAKHSTAQLSTAQHMVCCHQACALCSRAGKTSSLSIYSGTNWLRSRHRVQYGAAWA